MLNKIVNWFKKQVKIMNIKWVKGQCSHLCIWCEYRHECLEHFE